MLLGCRHGFHAHGGASFDDSCSSTGCSISHTGSISSPMRLRPCTRSFSYLLLEALVASFVAFVCAPSLWAPMTWTRSSFLSSSFWAPLYLYGRPSDSPRLFYAASGLASPGVGRVLARAGAKGRVAFHGAAHTHWSSYDCAACPSFRMPSSVKSALDSLLERRGVLREAVLTVLDSIFQTATRKRQVIAYIAGQSTCIHQVMQRATSQPDDAVERRRVLPIAIPAGSLLYSSSSRRPTLAPPPTQRLRLHPRSRRQAERYMCAGTPRIVVSSCTA